MFDLAQGQAFAGHALGRPILGVPATVNAADRQALEAFAAKQYARSNLVVSAAGAVDEDELLSLVERTFAGADALAPDQSEPAAFTAGQAGEARRLEQAHTVLLLPGVGARDPAYFAQRLFAEALGGGMSSRLFQEARERLGLAYAIDAYAESYADIGALGVYAGTAAGDADRTVKVCAEQLKALAEQIGEQELARSKAQLKAHIFMARESPLARAEQSAGQALLFDRLYTPAELAEAVDRVSPQDIRAYADRVLQPKLSAGAVLGAKSALKATETFRRVLFG